jgi:hypothetical protein
MKRISLILFVALMAMGTVSAQYSTERSPLRSLLEIPTMYLMTNDVQNIAEEVGAGINVGYALGTHHMLSRVYGGFEASTNAKESNLGDHMYYNPFVGAEIGGGLWRTNGNKCAAKNRGAYTAAAKAGLRYNIGSRDAMPDENVEAIESGMDYYAGIELAYFYIDNYKTNSDVMLEAGYFFQKQSFFVRFGFRTFINLRAISAN